MGFASLNPSNDPPRPPTSPPLVNLPRLGCRLGFWGVAYGYESGGGGADEPAECRSVAGRDVGAEIEPRFPEGSGPDLARRRPADALPRQYRPRRRRQSQYRGL